MKMECAIIGDLLPLYIDSACSEESKAAVQQHLADCPACRKKAEEMAEEETETLRENLGLVLEHREKTVRRKTFTVGCVLAGVFFLPVLVCLIVNLCAGAALNWFFIVLASMLLSASLVVVPLMVRENKFVMTVGASTASLLLLLLVCSLYTGGEWFYVASTAILFGGGAVLLPILLRRKPLQGLVGNHKALCYFTVETFLYAAMMVAIGLYAGGGNFKRVSVAVSLPFFAMAWLVMLLLRYLPCRRLCRWGCVSWLTGWFLFSATWQVAGLLGEKASLPLLHLQDWSGQNINDNILWLCLLAGILWGVILLCLGMFRKGRKK